MREFSLLGHCDSLNGGGGKVRKRAARNTEEDTRRPPLPVARADFLA